MCRKLAILLLVLSLGGCQSFADSYAGGAAFRVPPGTVLTLNTPLRVSRNSTRVLVQNGASGRIRQFYPHCRFELATPSGTARTIETGDYKIVSSSLERGYFARNGDPLMLAALRTGRGGDQPSHVTFATHFHFSGEGPSDLYRLTCARLGDWYENAYVTVAEAQATLGHVATFQLDPQ